MPFPLDSQCEEHYFPNCLKLSREARSVITSESSLACLPGSTMPTEFDHRAKGNFLTIRSDSKVFRICAVVSPKPQMKQCSLSYRIHLNGCLIEEYIYFHVHVLQTEHLFIADAFIFEEDGWLEQGNEISFEFSDVIECGVRIMAFETDASSSEQDDDGNLSDGSDASSSEQDDDEISL
ncbi:unnamed protein product [Arabis nemorensis]|nr:unnamed protein product [Arabis nemorensis]